MNIDIRLSLDFFDHPKSKKLKKRLGLEGVMALLKLWAWTAGNRPGGMLTGLDAEAVELAADWDGEDGTFVSTLLDLRLLDDADGTFAIHDWEDHQAYASKSEERSSKAKKAAEARWSKAKEDMVAGASNAQPMLTDATSINEHAFSNAPETRNQKPVFYNTTPDGVVVDADPGDDHDAPASEPEEKNPRIDLDRPDPHTRPGEIPCPHKRIIEVYEAILPELPRVRVWRVQQAADLRARWREKLREGKFSDEESGVDYFRRFFGYVRRSEFLMGRRSGRDGRTFRNCLAWMVKAKNFDGIVDGKYHDQEAA